MGFLWQLLPGAREARNQVVIGYAWLLGLGLLFGLPTPDKGTNLRELIDSMGAIGVGIALSVISFLIGSFSDDSFEVLLSTRAGLAVSQLSDGRTVDVLRRMEEWGVRTETERLEAKIDRMNAEVLLRVGLMPPVVLIGVATVLDGSPWQGAGPLAALGILGLQVLRRRRELIQSIMRSDQVGRDISEAVERDISDRQSERSRQEDAQREAAAAQREAALTPEERRSLREERERAQLELSRQREEQSLEQSRREEAQRIREMEEIQRAKQRDEELSAEFLALEQVPNKELSPTQARRLLTLLDREIAQSSRESVGMGELYAMLELQRRAYQELAAQYKRK